MTAEQVPRPDMNPYLLQKSIKRNKLTDINNKKSAIGNKRNIIFIYLHT